MKAESQWPAGEDHRAAVATSCSTRFRRMPTPYRYLRCGDLRSPGVAERRNGPLGLRDNDDDDDDDNNNNNNNVWAHADLAKQGLKEHQYYATVDVNRNSQTRQTLRYGSGAIQCIVCLRLCPTFPPPPQKVSRRFF